MKKLGGKSLMMMLLMSVLAGSFPTLAATMSPHEPAAKAASAAREAELAAFKKAIREKYDLKEKAWAARDAEAILTKFYTDDVVSVGEAEGIYVGRDKIRPLYEDVVQKYTVRVESQRTFVHGDAGWDWADFIVTPRNPRQSPSTLAILFVWAKVGGQWMCKGESYVFGSFRTGKVTGPPAELAK